MNILFRSDSSSIIGTGHIMRDLVLAKQYKKSKIIFATQNLKGNINFKIKKEGYELINLKSNSLIELDELIKRLKIDLLVFDHYEIDEGFEKSIKLKNPKIKILSFDDTYERHYCDILLNHNINADKNKYKKLVPPGCELRCGSKYTLLRDEFYIQKNKSPHNKEKKTIFLGMGGSDHQNINIKILEVIKEFKNLDVIIVTTTANKNINELKKYSKKKKWINLHINSNKIAKLMRKSDFAIVTPSVIVNEVYFLKIPFIAIKTAKNQKEMYKYLKKNYLVMKKFDKLKLKKYIERLVQDNEQ